MSATADFVGAALPQAPALPYSTQVASLSSDRFLDVAIIVAVCAALYGLGYLIRESALPSFNPAVFASVGLGVLMFTVVNPVFWKLQGVTVDDEGLVCEYWSGADRRIAWTDVAEVRVDEGGIFPVFTDDRALVLTDANGDEYPIPGMLPGAAEVAAVVAAKR